MSLARWMVVVIGAFSLSISSCGGGTDTAGDAPPGDAPGGSAAVAFDLSRAVGIVKVSGGANGKAIDPSQPFKKLTEAGAIEDFVAGSLSIQDVFVSPAGELFLILRPSLMPPSIDAPPSEWDGCALLRVGGEGIPECIDRTIDEVVGGSALYFRSPPIQFDGGGAIYYAGRAGGETVLRRRTPDGVVTDLISEHMDLGDFIAMPGGEVYLHGATRDTGSLWLRRLDAAGLHEIEGAESRTLWMNLFPDGNIYVGSMGIGLFETFDEYNGIYVIEAASGAIRKRCWMEQYEGVWNKCDPCNALGYVAPDFTQESLCAAAGRDRFCFEPLMEQFVRTPDGAVFGVTDSSIRDIWKMYPAMEYFPVASIAKISVVAGLLDHLVVAGDDGAGRKRMVLKSIATGEEFDLLGEMEVEVYHAIFGRDGKIWFDGRRFGDNVDVIGVVDPTDGYRLTFLSSLDFAIESLIAF